jgi:FKBP-type peptidyl-prolyl cis-trans isomerase
VLIAVASKDGYDPTGNGSAIRKGDSVIFVVDVEKVSNPLAEAKGTPLKAPATVPTLTYDKDKHPAKFKATKDTPKTVDKLGVYPIIKGKGPAVKAGQTVTAEYVAQLYPDGKVFDESWSSDQPRQFPIGTGGVIKAWDEGLVGQTVGSRVILVVPSALAYGKQGSPPDVPPDADLIFVIDILQAQ